MKDPFNTPRESIIYEDNRVYVALAYKPLTEGHCVVVWKEDVSDINMLDTNDYEYLMDAVDVTRDVLREFCSVEKVYLMYWDEARHVHWHLVPRYEEKGANILQHKPSLLTDFSDAQLLRKRYMSHYKKMLAEN